MAAGRLKAAGRFASRFPGGDCVPGGRTLVGRAFRTPGQDLRNEPGSHTRYGMSQESGEVAVIRAGQHAPSADPAVAGSGAVGDMEPPNGPGNPANRVLPAQGGRSRTVRTVANGLALLGSGGVASLGFAALTSGRVSAMDSAVAVGLLLFIQWQVIGITIAKLGVESLVFVTVHRDPSVRPTLRHHIATRTLPLALLFSILVGFIFSPVIGALCFVSVALDAHAASMVAELSARERFMETAFVSLLNYPLFFLVLFTLSSWSRLDLIDVLVIFTGSSFARWIYLRLRARRNRTLRPISVVAGVGMGMQQLLNFLLFRIDQLFLGTALAAAVISTQSGDFVRQFVYLARYPELASNVVVALAAMVLPRLFMRQPKMWQDAVLHLRRHRLLAALTVLGGVCAFIVYVTIWEGSTIPVLFGVPFLISALTALPVNAVSYSFIREQRIRLLVRNLAVSVGIGAILLLVAYWTGSVYPLLYAVPVQQIVFLTFALFR